MSKKLITSYFEKKAGPAPASSLVLSNTSLQLRVQKLENLKREACQILSVSFQNSRIGRLDDITKHRRKLVQDAIEIWEQKEESGESQSILEIMKDLNIALVRIHFSEFCCPCVKCRKW